MEQQNNIFKLKNDTKRPVLITIICVIGFIAAILTFIMAFSGTTKLIGSWYPVYLIATRVITIIGIIGLWKMKKWAAYTYIAVLTLNQFILIALGTWNAIGLIFPAVVAGVILSQIKKMN